MCVVLKKLYCYVDETGQDTEGELFLVTIVLEESDKIELIERTLKEIELKTGKKQLKWKKTNNEIKIKYIQEINSLKTLRNSIFYAMYRNSKEYPKLTSLTIAKAVLLKNYDNYRVTVIIDGLNNSEREMVRKELKNLKIRYNKIRGMKDEQSAYLRLADAIAGFLRDIEETQVYTRSFMDRTIIKKTIRKI